MTHLRPIDRVLALAEAKGWSDRHLQAEAGIAVGLLSKAKAGQQMKLDILEKLATALGVPVSQLLGEAPPVAAPADPTFVRRPLAALRLSPKNERTHCDAAGIDTLAKDIAQRGLLQPLIIYPAQDQPGIDLVAEGGRRLRALHRLEDGDAIPDEIDQLGVPCRLVADEAEAMVVTIVANFQREDVHFLDRAAAIARLRDELGWDTVRIAGQLNMSLRVVQIALQIHDRLDADNRALAFAGQLTQRDCLERVQAPKPVAVSSDPPAFLRRPDPAGTPLAPVEIEYYAARRQEVGGAAATEAGPDLAEGQGFARLTDDELQHLWWERRGLTAQTFVAIEDELKRRKIGLASMSFSAGPKDLPHHLRQRGELVFPLVEIAFMGQSWSTGRQEFYFKDRRTGQRFSAVLIDKSPEPMEPQPPGVTTADDVAETLACAIAQAKGWHGPSSNPDDFWVEDYGLNPVPLIEDAFHIKVKGDDYALLAGGTFGQAVAWVCAQLGIPQSQAAE